MADPGSDWSEREQAGPGAIAAKSKSQLKRELHALDALVRELLRLSDRQLLALGLSPDVHDAIVAARTMRRGALQRQLRYARGLIAQGAPDALAQAIERQRRPQREAVASLHEIERWRDDLIAGDRATFELLLTRFPALDRQHLMQLVRNSQKEQQAQRPPRAARLLFKYLDGLRAGE